jgi:hypothetical protein
MGLHILKENIEAASPRTDRFDFSNGLAEA